MVVVYEVNLVVQKEIENNYAQWLDHHIEEIMEIDGFLSAKWMDLEEKGDDLRWTIIYILRDRKALTEYQEVHAPRLMSEGLRKFENKFEANRRVMVERKSYAGKSQQ